MSTYKTDISNHEVIVHLKNLVKIYGKGETAVKAVDNFSLHVIRGEVILIMGPSGSGKTTLVQLIAGLLTPTSGEIIVNGKDIVNSSKKELPKFRLKTIGFIFQKPNLLSALTALQNVEIALNLNGLKGKKARKKATELLEKMNLGHRLNHRPNKLSGGEQQRVAIARALANDPPILIADEPTANLDSKTGQMIIELLRKAAKEQGKTVIIVTHDLRIRNFADRVLWLEDGKLSVRWNKGKVKIDPVCLMAIEDEENMIEHNYEDSVFYFCSTECKKDFDKNPSAYLGTNSHIYAEQVS